MVGCKKDTEPDISYPLNIPEWFPAMQIPADNQLTVDRVKLGKMLFFDNRLSHDSTVSCASCHFQQNAFADSRAVSPGVGGALFFRNAISLGNTGYQPYYFMDGGVPTLELQALAPISNEKELDFDLQPLLQRLSTDKTYQTMALKAYGRVLDDYVLVRALASFERTLVTGHSRYDEYKYEGNTSAMNTEEINGMNLFFSDRTHCADCHSGANFTDYSFRDVGLYQVYADSGRARITTLDEDKGKFKVPSLRNVEVTAPYMHDGSLATLNDVVDFFNTGGMGHFNQDTLIRPLNLTVKEKSDLVSFLKTLTDNDFLNSPDFKP